ncbi:hypothetical protein JOF42_002625 [Microbacterium phyllosphaerae]|uniref:DUF1611 domain-containing protein n=1 Tax=Microbacterium phyllosphaerae TaxID=124798 RepID=A0ABS4WSE8_9MICO|nr:DUF1611 domain-containing protein [Microbacterium phyllosphaerae]MBP2379130.1 hypothetical protein [Microbacterium phyllosphaerae]
MKRETWVRMLPHEMRIAAKQSFSTRRVPLESMRTLVGGAVRPRSGDVVIARIERLGHHRHIEQPHGRRSLLHVGDLIIVAYADRYATDQFESYVPRHLGPVNLVASGGIASAAISRSRSVRPATDIVPIGLIGDEAGRPLNVADFRLPTLAPPAERPRTIGVLGTSMNAGKTTTIHYMAHGLSKVGMRPGVTKVTGTGSGNDYWVMLDAGAHMMLDFTDAGLASSFRQPTSVLEEVMSQLVANLSLGGSGVNFVEIADGVFQRDNRSLLESAVVHDLIDCVVLAASDAMGAAQGLRSLTDHGFDVVALSGTMTKSPLAMQEAAEELDLPIWGLPELENAELIAPVLGIDPTMLRAPVPPPQPAWPIDLAGLEPLAETRLATSTVELAGRRGGFRDSTELIEQVRASSMVLS